MNTKLYVGNLSYSTTESDLRELFSQSGNIRSVTIPTDRMTGQPRGFAFVEMESAEDASKAIRACDGQMLGGRQIKVNEAKPQEARSGGGGGGFGGGDRGNRDRRGGGGGRDRRY
ncbi:MAG: RNA-binding protein [Chloroflexi bacterium]|nr:RNA-binding protein [Chloroflexota bacterium]